MNKHNIFHIFTFLWYSLVCCLTDCMDLHLDIIYIEPLGKSLKSRQQCQILSDVILKEPAILPSPLRSSANATNAPPMMNSIHQTSDCHPISYDPYNLNQTHSSSISNTSSKSNKNRKLSSASTAAVNSHHYNQHHNNNNHLYNGETNFLHNHDWSTAAGSGGGVQDSIIARSRTSSPTHGSSYYSKNER